VPAAETELEFDRKVSIFGDQLLKELGETTARRVDKPFEWKPHRLNLGSIPAQYHERISHYILQAYMLPHAEKHVAYNAGQFVMERTRLAQALISRGDAGIESIGDNLAEFKGADSQLLFNALVSVQSKWEWLAHVDCLPDIPRWEIVSAALERGEECQLFANLQKLHLDQQDQSKLVDVAFTGVSSPLDSIVLLGPHPFVDELILNLHKLDKVDYGYVLERAVAFSESSARVVARVLSRFTGVNNERLAQLCEERRADRYWCADENNYFPDETEALIELFRNYHRLDAQRIAELSNRAWVTDELHLVTGSHFDRFPRKFHEFAAWASDVMSQGPAERREMVDAYLAEAFTYRDYCTWFLRTFDRIRDLECLEASEVAERILAEHPDSFLECGEHLGLPTAELALTLIQKGALQDPDFLQVKDDDSQLVQLIRLGGHDEKIAELLLGAGRGVEILENLTCFVGLSDKTRYEAAFQTVFKCVLEGRVDTAYRDVLHYGVSVEELNQKLALVVERDISTNDLSPEALFRRIAVAAWSLYSPEIVSIDVFARDSMRLEPYRKLFGVVDREHLSRIAKQNLLQNLVSLGIPLLLELKWVREDTIASLSTILPEFLESTTGSENAWRAFFFNMWIDKHADSLPVIVRNEAGTRDDWIPNGGPFYEHLWEKPSRRVGDSANRSYSGRYLSPFAADGVNPIQELKALREFYKEFGVFQGPQLYWKVYREWREAMPTAGSADAIKGLASSDKFKVIKSKLGHLRNKMIAEDFSGLVNTPVGGLEYLAGWVGIRASRNILEGWPWEEAPNSAFLRDRIHNDIIEARVRARPKDPRLTVRTVNIQRASGTPELGRNFSKTKGALSEFAAALEGVNGRSAAAVFTSEKGEMHVALERQISMKREWLLKAPLNSSQHSQVEAIRRQVDQLGGILRALMNVPTAEKLVEFVCKLPSGLRIDSLIRSLNRVAIALGLEKLPDPAEFIYSVAEESPDKSVMRIVEFLQVQVLQESLKGVDEEVLKVAKKALSYSTFEKVARNAAQDCLDSSRANRPSAAPARADEVIVLPTRGPLAELAGFFSEACWTDKDNLMREHPNATALIFARREKPVTLEELSRDCVDFSEATLLGACYILQVHDTEGNRVIALRGINPRERVCVKWNIQSFIEGLLDDVVVPYAKALRVTKIVVPFDDLGHAQTNRPQIESYLKNRYGESEYVPLAPEGTLFNDRVIFDKCRLLRKVES
jgi:hypothetical protein